MDLLTMATENTGILDGPDGRARCFWHGNLPDYLHYHDHEWGRPVTDDRRLFEKICLEGFQSGLSWLTILRKQQNFRSAFAGFDFARVARFEAGHVGGAPRHAKDGRIARPLEGSQEARLDLRRSHNDLRLHAGCGHRQRS